MKKGYAQVLKDKSLNEQLGALKNQGCEKIYQERLASSWEERTQLAELIANLRSGDVVVICRFSIIARSLKQLLDLVSDLKIKRVEFISIQEQIDTTTPTGVHVFTAFSSLLEFKRKIWKERTMEGLAAAKACGRVGGRKRGLSKVAKMKAATAKCLYAEGKKSIEEISEALYEEVTDYYPSLSLPFICKITRHFIVKSYIIANLRLERICFRLHKTYL